MYPIAFPIIENSKDEPINSWIKECWKSLNIHYFASYKTNCHLLRPESYPLTMRIICRPKLVHPSDYQTYTNQANADIIKCHTEQL